MTIVPSAMASRGRDDRGAQAVEFALLLPVLLIIVLGIINFGYVFGQKLSLNQAVREGARLAVVSASADSTDIAGYVRDATGGLIPSPDPNVAVASDVQSPEPSGSFTSTGSQDCEDYSLLGGQLRVRATFQSTWLIPIPYLPISAPNLTSEAVFRCEVIA